MTRQMKVVLGLGLALALTRPGFAQDKAAEAVKDKDAQSLDIRVQFDKESAKGEITCKEGAIKGGSVEYKKCPHDKLDNYKEMAIQKKIISKEKYGQVEAKKQRLAKKLALYDSARKELKKELTDLGEAKKGEIEYKKKEGALKKIDKDFDKQLADCAKEDKEVFTCPAKD